MPDDDRPTYLRPENGTCWPNPSDPNEVGWRLRYGQPTREDLLWAASVIDAYRQMVWPNPGDRKLVQDAATAELRAAVGGSVDV